MSVVLYIQDFQLIMTPTEYMEKLLDAQRTLDSVKNDLNFAIHRIVRRIDTGDESMERDSRLVVLAAREYVKLVDDVLLKIATAKIEY